MTPHQPLTWPPDFDPAESASDTPIIRLADHAIGLWRAAQDIGDPVLLEALRPLVIHIARGLARDLIEQADTETTH